VWNTAGDVVQTTAPGGLALTYTYDYAHRLTGTYQQGDPDALETRSYDGTGRLVAVVDAVHRTTLVPVLRRQPAHGTPGWSGWSGRTASRTRR
jgi:YD repeat-containing protein